MWLQPKLMKNLSLGGVVFLLALLAGLLKPTGSPIRTTQAADNASCLNFSQTGHQICGRFLDYWQTHGGLAQQGYPISEVFEEKNADPPAGDGKTHQVQYFERARFELHPENQRPYDVLLGLLGREQLTAKYSKGTPPAARPEAINCQDFPQTGFSVCGNFLTYWQTHGGLEQQGLPISPMFTEQNAPPPAGDGQSHLVQYFERARFEAHPENQPPYDVLLGLLGTEQYSAKYQKAAPVPTPNPTPTPKPAQIRTIPQASTPITPTNFGGKGTVQDQNFISPILNLEVPYRIYLPPGYATSNRNYPVLYALHGYGGNYLEWDNLGLLGRADDLISSGAIPPLIIVLPYGAQDYWLNHANNGPRWGDYTVYDVVNFIDTNYRTIPDPAHRAIGGLSMGGHGALQNGFNHPEIFGIVGAHSPTLRTLDQNPGYFGDAAYFATIDPVILARTKDLSGLKIWLDIGANDLLWRDRATELHQVLQQRNIPHTWLNGPGDHVGEYWAGHIIDYLKFYTGAFPNS